MRHSLLSLTISVVLSSCALWHHENVITVAPSAVVSEQASFDQNRQNSGIVSASSDGFVVTSHFLDRHGIRHSFLVMDYGVTSRPDGNYTITAELMARCVEQDRFRKNQQK